MVIAVSHLTKRYAVYKKAPGLMGSLRSLVSRRYEQVTAVDDVTFTISEGEFVGFIGPNGAGKTTTLKCLSGLLFPTSGSISVLGYTPFDRRPEYLRQIALVMGQKNQLWWDLPALETFHLNKEIYEIPDDLFTRRLGELSELLDVSRLIHVPVRKLSLGERMKMELIASLLHGPRILFLDEPTIGLDVLMQKNLREFLKEYNEKYHATILLTSHYMEDVKQLAKRVIVINSGSAVYDGKLDLLVKKYAKHKILSMLLGSYVPPDQFSGIGTLVSYEYPRAVIRVPRAASNAAAAQLLEKFPVDDLTIEEPDMEDIVRDVFVKG